VSAVCTAKLKGPFGTPALGEDFRAVAGGADLGYLRRWAGDLGVADALEKCLDERHDA